MTTILLHPVGLDRRTWGALDLPEARAIDLPGHGDAPMAEVGGLDGVADLVLDGLADTEPVDIVGESLGGMVALHMGIRHPSRVRSLVVACAPAATPGDVMSARADETAELGMDGVMDATLKRWFSPETLGQAPAFVVDTIRRLLSDDARTVARFWRMIAGHDVRDGLSGLRMPVTVVAGSEDVSVPPSAARDLAQRLPNARYVELVGSHMLHLESPGPFAETVLGHLSWAESLR